MTTHTPDGLARDAARRLLLPLALGLSACGSPGTSGEMVSGFGGGDPSSGPDDHDEDTVPAPGTGGGGGDDRDSGADTDDAGPLLDVGPPGGDRPSPGNCETDLVATIRDFRQDHPDFEYVVNTDPGIVQPMLGGDGKPVYAGGTHGTTTGQANFDQWYRTVEGINLELPIELTLVHQGEGTYVFDDSEFFPIDGSGFGNENLGHNYHFTLELHLQFVYEGGEVFTFRGDDDLFTFVNHRLAIDLGGVHGPLEGSADLDAMAETLDITPGNTYDLHFFFAERHTSQSNFRIETTIGCFAPQG